MEEIEMYIYSKLFGKLDLVDIEHLLKKIKEIFTKEMLKDE